MVIALSAAFVVLGYWMMWSALKKSRLLRNLFETAGREPLFTHRQFLVMTFALQVLIVTVVGLYLLAR